MCLFTWMPKILNNSCACRPRTPYTMSSSAPANTSVHRPCASNMPFKMVFTMCRARLHLSLHGLTGLAHAAGPGHHMCCWQAFPGYAELILIDMVTER